MYWPSKRELPSIVLAALLYRLFLALEFLQTKCHITHTDIKPDNIISEEKDDLVFLVFEEYEPQNPVPRKEVYKEGRMI
ncbi:kinase-like protein [Penicillium malachiteum]|uniref:Kinase-like protein n=1 Tax=Penicillium malachiteum TaxID=1324776 RepID=A0AAD6HGR4_9EURO|nr:kinase-like protein [Penicillium malachiteum]